MVEKKSRLSVVIIPLILIQINMVLGSIYSWGAILGTKELRTLSH